MKLTKQQFRKKGFADAVFKVFFSNGNNVDMIEDMAEHYDIYYEPMESNKVYVYKTIKGGN